MSVNSLIEVRLVGQGLSPGQVKSKEIADLIKSVEEMVSEFIANDPDISKQDIVVGIDKIESGSLSLQFASNYEEQTLRAFRNIGSFVKNKGETGLFSVALLKPLERIRKFTEDYECAAELREVRGKRELLGIIYPDFSPPERMSFSGETTLYGTIVRVGGTRKPTIELKTIDEKSIRCDLDRNLAIKAASRLYEEVGLEGVATWDAETLELQRFNVIAIMDYQRVPLTEAFDRLSRSVGDSFARIGDVDEFVKKIRYESDEEEN